MNALAVAALLILAMPLAGLAHHGWSGYDSTRPLTLTGTIADVVLVGAAFMFDARLLGTSRAVPVTALERHLLRWARRSVLVIVPTGVSMFVAHATEMAANPAFRLKLILIAAAALNAAIFHRVPFRSVGMWDTEVVAPRLARVAGALSLALWTGVIACGRLLAYF